MKKAIVIVAALAAVLVLGGCGASNTPAQNSSSGQASSSSSSTSDTAKSADDSKAKDNSSATQDSKAKDTEADKKSSSAEKAKEQEKAKEGSPLSKSQVTSIIEDNEYGEIVDLKEAKHSDGKWYWEVTASLDDGSVHEYLVDPDGNVTSTDEDTGISDPATDTTKNKLSASDLENIIWEQGLGEIVSTEKVTYDDGVQYWEVVTRGSDGKKYTFVVDPKGNVSEK